MAKLSGGRMLAKLNRENPNLGALFARIIDSHNHMAEQLGVAPVGQNVAPPSPNAVDVTVTGEQAHVRITDNSATNRARTYFTEVHSDPSFSKPLVVKSSSASRSLEPITLPTFDSGGLMKAYYIRTYSQDPGSPPSKPVDYPTYVTLDGATQGDVPSAQGSGTSTPTQSAQGFGVAPTRPATGPKRAV